MSYADTYSLRAQTVTFNNVADAIDALLTGSLVPPINREYSIGSSSFCFEQVCSNSVLSDTALQFFTGGNTTYGIEYKWTGALGFHFAPMDGTSTGQADLGTPDNKWGHVYCGRIHSLATYDYTAGVSANLYVNSDGDFKRATSSARYKTNIKYNLDGSKVYQLKPASFTANDNKNYIGLIAEDVALVEPRLVDYDKEGRPDAVHYGLITALLIKAIQDLKAEVEQLKKQQG